MIELGMIASGIRQAQKNKATVDELIERLPTEGTTTIHWPGPFAPLFMAPCPGLAPLLEGRKRDRLAKAVKAAKECNDMLNLCDTLGVSRRTTPL